MASGVEKEKEGLTVLRIIIMITIIIILCFIIIIIC